MATEGALLPRFMNRGLIEVLSTTTPFEPRSILPRFMNRGLIEVPTIHKARQRAALDTSPIHESGPH